MTKHEIETIIVNELMFWQQISIDTEGDVKMFHRGGCAALRRVLEELKKAPEAATPKGN